MKKLLIACILSLAASAPAIAEEPVANSEQKLFSNCFVTADGMLHCPLNMIGSNTETAVPAPSISESTRRPNEDVETGDDARTGYEGKQNKKLEDRKNK